mgnify:CR=1 FL=1
MGRLGEIQIESYLQLVEVFPRPPNLHEREDVWRPRSEDVDSREEQRRIVGSFVGLLNSARGLLLTESEI